VPLTPKPCGGCGTDTAPCTNQPGCRHMGRWEWVYRLAEDVWAAVAQGDPYLCIGCVEVRLGRELTPADFAAPGDEWHPYDTDRLAARKAGRPWRPGSATSTQPPRRPGLP